MPVNKSLTAGDEIDSRCLKCKAVTNHTIVAMQNGVVAKVECNTCHGRHNYRPPVPEKGGRRQGGFVKDRGAARAAGRVSPELMAAARYEEALAGRNREEARPYAMNASFASGELIAHPSFGVGLVTKKIGATRVEVIFHSGVKILVCGQPSAGEEGEGGSGRSA